MAPSSALSDQVMAVCARLRILSPGIVEHPQVLVMRTAYCSCVQYRA